jgi:hypothetical protein
VKARARSDSGTPAAGTVTSPAARDAQLYEKYADELIRFATALAGGGATTIGNEPLPDPTFVSLSVLTFQLMRLQPG